MSQPEPEFADAEILAAYDVYVAQRDRVERGDAPWDSLADFFTDDAVFVDPAWGRIQGIDEIRRFLNDSMAGLEGWTFPRQWTAVAEGNRLVSGWQNRLPGSRPDGTPWEAPGVTVMVYAGEGKFSSEEDILNMLHIAELVQQSGWKPGPGFTPPPANPRR